METRDQEGNLSLQVKNVPRAVIGRFPVRYYSGTAWKEVDGITLQEGNAQWEKQEVEQVGVFSLHQDPASVAHSFHQPGHHRVFAMAGDHRTGVPDAHSDMFSYGFVFTFRSNTAEP